MRRQLSEIRFYQTYYFANAIRNVLHDPSAYLFELDEFDELYDEPAYAVPFPRRSAFHSFIWFIVNNILSREVGNIDLSSRQEAFRRFSSDPPPHMRPSNFPINEALNYYKIEHDAFEEWLKRHNKTFLEATDDDLSEYYQELRLSGPYDALLEKAVGEVFFVLFQNRRLLLFFNNMMASQVESYELDQVPDEYRRHFASSGVLKRVGIPGWVKRAVFYRDRGLCAICHRDLSGVLNIFTAEHYDHIVPLARGGLNDVSNIQLLCEGCNLKKLHHEATTSDYYEVWYSMSEQQDG